MTVPLPEREDRRMSALKNYNVLDTAPEQDYDDVTNLAAVICKSPIALISLVDEERQWFKSKFGLEANETPREHAFCAHAICNPDDLFVVEDASKDERFQANPLVTGNPNIRFYAGAPLVTTEGDAVGTICVIDDKARKLTDKEAEALRTLSRMVVAQLELRRNLSSMEQTVLEQEDYVANLENYWQKIEESHANLRVAAVTDELTGLQNRRGFENRLSEEFSRASREQTPLSMMVLDIDHFKSFNDTFGHHAGDQALQMMGELLQEAVRDYDIAARYGGEEFVVILPNTGAPGAVVLAERIRRIAQKAVWPRRQVTLSIGTSTLGPAINNGNELFKAADKALYEAKAAGRNCCKHAAASSDDAPLARAG